MPIDGFLFGGGTALSLIHTNEFDCTLRSTQKSSVVRCVDLIISAHFCNLIVEQIYYWNEN